jgi:hypothetical protein
VTDGIDEHFYFKVVLVRKGETVISEAVVQEAFFDLDSVEVVGGLRGSGVCGGIVGVDDFFDAAHFEFFIFFEVSADGGVEDSNSSPDN